MDRRASLMARTEAQRQALSYYVARLERPAHVFETCWRVMRFMRSPLVAAAVSLLLIKKKRSRRRSRPGIGWFLRHGWRLFALFKRFAN